MFLTTRKGLVALLAVSAGVLSACGGGGASVDVSGGVISAGPQQVSSRVQPADAVQDVPSMRMRTKSEASVLKPGRVALGPLGLSKAQSVPFEPGIAMKVGETRSIHQTSAAAATLRQFQWQPTPAGGASGRYQFRVRKRFGCSPGCSDRAITGWRHAAGV